MTGTKALLPLKALRAQQRRPLCRAAARAAAAPAALPVCNLSCLGTVAVLDCVVVFRAVALIHLMRAIWQRSSSSLCDLAGARRQQLVYVAEQLADLLGCQTERLEEARSLLQEALEVSMVSVTLLCCHVQLASPSSQSVS